MSKLKLTLGALLRKARELKWIGFDRRSRMLYLSGLINGAENWELLE